ncbi:MAG: HAMP domain-containing histidine kinase [Polyangiaceae bacterium]|nr:HAMP domain-containing histidine kinase [Polyangiaceae bacterium]
MFWLNLLACFTSLAVALAFLLSGARGRLAIRTGLVAVSMFAWNFASLAHDLTQKPTWEVLDLASSPLTVVLGLDLTLTFAGRAREHRGALLVAYAWLGAISLSNLLSYFVPGLAWWCDSTAMNALFLIGIGGAFGLALAVLVGHIRRRPGRERRRALLLLGGVLVGGLFGATVLVNSLWIQFSASAAPGAIVGAIALAFGLAHEDLAGARIGPQIWTAALGLSALACGSFLLALLAVDPRSSAPFFGTATIALVLGLMAREVAAQRARRREQELGAMVRGRISEQLVHDLRNPLAALHGAAQYLEAEPGSLTSEQAHMVGLMLDEVRRVERLVDEHHRMARAEPERAPANLRDMFERLAANGRAAFPQHPVTFEVAPEAERTEIDGDLVMLALENLVRNARDALPEGGEIRVNAHRDGRYLVLAVRDGGSGFEPRARERAFDELFTTKRGGSGLGLAFVRRVARAHGGDATITSTREHGTMVTMRLLASRSVRAQPETRSR